MTTDTLNVEREGEEGNALCREHRWWCGSGSGGGWYGQRVR